MYTCAKQVSYNALVQVIYSAEYRQDLCFSDTIKLWWRMYQKRAELPWLMSRALVLDDHFDDLCQLADSWLDSEYLHSLERACLIAMLVEVLYFRMPVGKARRYFGFSSELFGDQKVRGFVLSVLERNLS